MVNSAPDRVQREKLTDNSVQSQTELTGNPLEWQAWLVSQYSGDKDHLQRNACARAADAGAVSALRTASSNVEATNRTLWTCRVSDAGKRQGWKL